MARVEIVDDTQRRNVCVEVDNDVRDKFLKANGVLLPANVKFLPMRDRYRRQVQETVETVIVFEERRLEVAVRRAKCWLKRRDRPKGSGTPSHIAQMLLAYLKHDPKGFEADAVG